jgi:hypothetical protein
MGEHSCNRKRIIEFANKEETTERRSIERRTKKSEGYTYIQIVGWIDRREKNRRDSDSLTV